MAETTYRYEKWERDWKDQACPRCEKQRATAHGWRFADPPPTDSSVDDRKPIEEVYLHEDGTECRVVSTQ